MLKKLAVSGIKARYKDYVILFFGLVMSSAIFYMFEALATNQSFLKANAQVTGAGIIFQFGAILLTIITLVYTFYANSFLMSMRRHDYGLLMMLGAKQSKIGQLILLETLIVGTSASVIGAIVGWGLTGSLGSFLMAKMIGSTLSHFSAFYLPAFIITIVLYVILFMLAGIINRRTLTKTPVLVLLKGDQQPNRPVLKPFQQLIQVVVGLGLLFVGYYAMANLKLLNLLAIPIALVTIVLGTYFLFNAIFVWLVVLLKRSAWATRGLGNFTLSQLSFRIRNYTKILSIVSILFALALGAITVGIGFQRQILSMANASSAYTAVLTNPTDNVKKQIGKLDLSTTAMYDQKETAHYVYYNEEQLRQQPVQTNGINNMMRHRNIKALEHPQYHNLTIKQLKNTPDKLLSLQGGNQATKQPMIVSAQKFNQIAGQSHRIIAFRVTDLKNSQAQLKRIMKSVQVNSMDQIPGSYGMFVTGTIFFGGFEFMGLFLGIAFLAMLASCLMFKILSGAAADKKRYEMLNKIGTRTSVLRRSVVKEVFVLFGLPAIVGVIHVLFGLQMFKILMIDPYGDLWLPFTIFGILYMIYYVITVMLYTHIVVPKVKIDQ